SHGKSANTRPQRRGAEDVEMQPERAIPRPLQAVRSAKSYLNSPNHLSGFNILKYRAASLNLQTNLCLGSHLSQFGYQLPRRRDNLRLWMRKAFVGALHTKPINFQVVLC